jgi:hypothetical protein
MLSLYLGSKCVGLSGSIGIYNQTAAADGSALLGNHCDSEDGISVFVCQFVPSVRQDSVSTQKTTTWNPLVCLISRLHHDSLCCLRKVVYIMQIVLRLGMFWSDLKV